MELVLRHEMSCDADTFWKCVYDDEYNRRMYVDLLKFQEFQKLSQEEKGDVIHRRVKLNPPKKDLPGPVAKVIGDLSYVEESAFDKKSQRFKVKIISSAMPDKTHINGEMWVEKKGEKRIERVAKMNIEVKVFMVGGLVEKSIADDMKKSYADAARFTDEFVKEKGW